MEIIEKNQNGQSLFPFLLGSEVSRSDSPALPRLVVLPVRGEARLGSRHLPGAAGRAGGGGGRRARLRGRAARGGQGLQGGGAGRALPGGGRHHRGHPQAAGRLVGRQVGAPLKLTRPRPQSEPAAASAACSDAAILPTDPAAASRLFEFLFLCIDLFIAQVIAFIRPLLVSLHTDTPPLQEVAEFSHIITAAS